jgi:hypothetical protein
VSKQSEFRQLRQLRKRVGKRVQMHLAVVTFTDEGVRFYYRAGVAFSYKPTGHERVDFAAAEQLKGELAARRFSFNVDNNVAVAPSVTLEYLQRMFPDMKVKIIPKNQSKENQA